jgi:hypothetical protein
VSRLVVVAGGVVAMYHVEPIDAVAVLLAFDSAIAWVQARRQKGEKRILFLVAAVISLLGVIAIVVSRILPP